MKWARNSVARTLVAGLKSSHFFRIHSAKRQARKEHRRQRYCIGRNAIMAVRDGLRASGNGKLSSAAPPVRLQQRRIISKICFTASPYIFTAMRLIFLQFDYKDREMVVNFLSQCSKNFEG